MSRRRWVTGTLLLLLWPLLWLLVWQFYLFEALEPSSEPGVAIFAYAGSRSFDLWIATGLGVLFLLLSVTLIAIGNVVRDELRKWGVAFIAIGAVLGLGGLSLPFLFPQVQSVVLDEVAGEVALQTRWLYWQERDAVQFADIDRIQHRKWNLWLGGQCLEYVTVKVIGHDRTTIAMPKGLRTDAMVKAIADAANAAPGQIETVTNYTC